MKRNHVAFPLRIITPSSMPGEVRAILKPGEIIQDHQGRIRQRPTHYFRVENEAQARKTRIAPYFRVHEFIDVDVYETASLRVWPRYMPCAVAILAAHLSALRATLGEGIYISANGGFRSPQHRKSTPDSIHAWGTAANIYRIGDEYLSKPEQVRKWRQRMRRLLPTASFRPIPCGGDSVVDHLHIDIGYVTHVPFPEGASK